MAKKVLRMRDRITVSRLSEVADGFGGFNNSEVVQGTYWCKLDHDKGVIEDREGQSQLVTDYTIYFRKKTGQLIEKGDVGAFETPALNVRINEIVEYDLQTYKATATSIE